MYINYENINDITFPVFGVNSDDFFLQDGLLFLDNIVLDDRNQIGETIGARRAQSPHKKYPIRYCYNDFISMLRGRHRIFIDNKGFWFVYEKTKYCKVEFHRIKKVVKKDTLSYLDVVSINFPVIVNRPPPEGKAWVGMLYVDGVPWMPYEYSETYCKPFKRMI